MAKKKKPVEEHPAVIDETTAVETPDTETVETPETPETPETAETTIAGVVANCKVLNVRKEPSTKAEVAATLICGTPIIISGESGDFYKVSGKDFSGFCMKTYIKIPQ